MLEAVAMWQQVLSRIFKVHESKNAKEHHPGWFLQAADLLERSSAEDERTLRNVAEACGMSYESFQSSQFSVAPARGSDHGDANECSQFSVSPVFSRASAGVRSRLAGIGGQKSET